MVIKTSRNEPCTELWGDSQIHININGQRNDTFDSAFTEHEFCSPTSKVNILHDTFQMQSSGTDGFCIESLFVNDKEILGPNSSQNNCRDVRMPTSEITIKNDQIIYFECKGKCF